MVEHGSYSLSISKQTLYVQCFGAWNLETAQHMGEQYKALVLKICEEPWACLLDLTKWELGTPEVWDYIDELNEWGNNHNQKFEAVVCCLSLQRALIEKSHEVLTEVDGRFFENMEQARAWLKSVSALPEQEE